MKKYVVATEWPDPEMNNITQPFDTIEEAEEFIMENEEEIWLLGGQMGIIEIQIGS